MKSDVDYSQSVELMNKVARSGDRMLGLMDSYLSKKAAPRTQERIRTLTPKSDRHKVHAKYSNATITTPIHLGFGIKTVKPFHYLYFPDTGTGWKNPMVQNFFGRGLEQEVDQIEKDLLNIIEEEI